MSEQEEPPNQNYIKMFDTMQEQTQAQEVDLEWQKNNLEYDLRSTAWICDKVKAHDSYAQNVYAALCNQDWQKNDVWPLLSGKTYSCSWRYAGGIVADMQEKGDYIDWYCSGIGGQNAEYEGEETDQAWQDRTGYVPEGTVTEEIQTDFFKLGWFPVDSDQEDNI